MEPAFVQQPKVSNIVRVHPNSSVQVSIFSGDLQNSANTMLRGNIGT